jgi:hypothetical protein
MDRAGRKKVCAIYDANVSLRSMARLRHEHDRRAPLPVVVGFLAASCIALTASAEENAPSRDVRTERKIRAATAKDRELSRRLEFLEDRIATQSTHARLWWFGWTAFHVIGAVVQGARAYVAVERVDQADLWVSTVESAGGAVMYLVSPYNGIDDFEPAPGPLIDKARLDRIRRGERILVHNADATDPFGPWYAHLINIGINAIGFVVVGAGFGGWKEGAISGGIGVAVGTAAILTSPWEADDDLEEYSAKYGTPAAREEAALRLGFRWKVRPAPGGLAWNATF